IVAGAAQGIAISAATRGLLHGSVLAHRAPIFTVIYLLSYCGATIPALIAGQLSNTFSLPQIAVGYGGLAVVATLVTVIAARNPHPAQPEIVSTVSSHDEPDRHPDLTRR
ncbi:MAG: hypothetical protein J2P17_33270, partial [Mycobacterium sp.]|nr:hypothetical protein [Mycobacterium sp.]